MLSVPHFRRRARDPAAGVEELIGVERAAAVVALVASRIFVTAVRAGALDVPIGQEALGLRVVELLRDAFVDVAVLQQPQKDVVDNRRVILGARARKEVEGDAELLPVAQELRVKLIDHLLWRAAFLIGAHRDRRAVLIAAGNHQHVVTCHPLIASEDIRG